MPVTAIDLANEALDLVGATAIVSFNDPTPEAKIVARAYGNVLERILRSYPWNCATTRRVLTPLTQAPSWGSELAYPLPDECVRVLGAEDCDQARRIESLYDGSQYLRCILVEGATSDGAPPDLNLIYIRVPDEPSALDPNLRELVTVELAVKIAAKLTESPRRISALVRRAEQVRSRAQSIDAEEAGRGQEHTESSTPGSWAQTLGNGG